MGMALLQSFILHVPSGIQNNTNFSVNGQPMEFMIHGQLILLSSNSTSANVQANNFSNDRNINGRYANGDLGELYSISALSDNDMERVRFILHINGEAVGINTSIQNDLKIASDGQGAYFDGLVDGKALIFSFITGGYESSSWDGTMKFQTSNTPLPPQGGYLYSRETMGAATLTAKLVSRDLSLPTVRIYYGDEDGGFDFNNWDSFVDVDSGNQVNLGEFNATIWIESWYHLPIFVHSQIVGRKRLVKWRSSGHR